VVVVVVRLHSLCNEYDSNLQAFSVIRSKSDVVVVNNVRCY